MSKHTPGPWRWWFRMGLPSCLAANHGDRPIVMDFARLGMNGAQPRFRVDQRMVKASEIENPSLHPDARLIVAAPELLEALEELVTLKLAKDIGFAYSPGDGLDIDAPEYHRRKGPAWAAARAALAKARGES